MTNPKDSIGAKKAPLAVVPVALSLAAAPAMAVGANKYGPFNWRAQPVQAMTYVEAAFRHLYAWVDGQDDAEDTGVSHLGHAIASLAILADAIAMENVIDNRPPAGPAADMLRSQDHSIVAVPPEDIAEPMPDTVFGLTFPELQHAIAVHDMEHPHPREHATDGSPCWCGPIRIKVAGIEGPVTFYGMPLDEWHAYGLPLNGCEYASVACPEDCEPCPVVDANLPMEEASGPIFVFCHDDPGCPACGVNYGEHTLACPYFV